MTDTLSPAAPVAPSGVGMHRLDPRMQQELAQQWREEYGRQW
ncbi:hypothetical protein [Streptomyces sp. NPDC002788]